MVGSYFSHAADLPITVEETAYNLLYGGNTFAYSLPLDMGGEFEGPVDGFRIVCGPGPARDVTVTVTFDSEGAWFPADQCIFIGKIDDFVWTYISCGPAYDYQITSGTTEATTTTDSVVLAIPESEVDIARYICVVSRSSGSTTLTAVEVEDGYYPPETADFSGTPLSGPEPLSVAFTDLSNGTPDSWAWDFGDGGTSTDQDPTHVYAVGTWTVALTTTWGATSDTETKVAYVVVGTGAAVIIDWEGDGLNSMDDDVTPYLSSWVITRGASPEITGGAQPGSCTLILNNPADDRFNPLNVSGPLYGKLTDGVPVWIGVNADGWLAGDDPRGLFAGRITDITPLPSGGTDVAPQVEIICEDPLGWYGRTPVRLSEFDPEV